MKERLRGCICTSFCFLLWIAALGGFTVNASDETAVFSSSYQNMSDVYDGNWIISKDDSLYSVYTQEGGLKFENKQGVPFLPDGTQNGTSNVHATMQLEGVLAESDTYGTRLTTDGMSGKYALEYTLQHRITTQRATKTYVTFGLGRRQDGSATMSGAWLQMRIYPNNVNVVRTVDGVRQDLTNIAPTALVNDQEWTLRVEFDTQQKLYTISINGEVCPKAVNIPFQGTAADFVPDIYFYMMDANDTGCYFWIKNIKLYAIDANEADARYVSGMGRMGQLPNTLVPDYTAVTSSFTVPEVNGVTWSSSNEELVGVDGTVTRWYDDQTVILTAAATADNGSGRSFCYKKAYTLHVPALESVSSTVRMDDTWSSAQDLGGWLFKGEGDVIPAAGSDGLRLAKSASAAEDEKAYAYLALYGTEPGGESGKTALYSAGHRGVYDVSFEITPVFGAGQPYAVAAGYLQGDRFYSCGSLELSQSGLYLSYASGVESLERERLADVQSGQRCSLTMRIDTEAQKLWILLDGQVCTTARTFYCALPEGASFALNALQVTINAGADPGDCITVHCAELAEYEREQPFTGAAVTAAAGLTYEQVAACVTTQRGAVSGLPAAASGGCTVTWTSDSRQVDLQQGRVYYSSAPASVTLSAYIADTAGGLPVSVRKDFYIAIPAAQSAEERVQADAVLLEQPSVDGNVVTLPDTGASGSSISWYTSDARVVTAAGAVTPAAQTEYVLLTACLTNDGEKAYRYFEICVPGTAEQALQRASVYDAAAPLVQSGWNMADSDYAYAALCADGMRMTQTASQYLNDAGAGNGAQTPPLGYVFGESAVERDAQNRTAVYTAQYSGIYEVDVAFSINGDFLTSYNGVELADAFYTMGVAAIADASNPAVRYTAGVLRLYPSAAIILNTSSSNTSSMSVKRAGLPGNFIASNAKFKVDTVTGTLTVTVNGDESKTSTGSLMSNAGYINGVFAYGMERFNAGSYLNIHSVTLRQLAHQYPAAVQTVLDQLPASLQTGSVTGDLNLPQISGVTWTTSNSAVIAADGSVTRPARDTDVTVSAVIAAGGYAYRKEYVVTVAAAEATNNNTFRPTDDETYWYEQPRNTDGSWDPYGYPMYGDPMHITDAEFFGVWDAVMQSWTTAPYFRYSDFPGMADVEAAAKAGNYETAKSELLEYYRSLQTSRAASSVSKPTDKDALYYELMARNVYAVGLISGDAVNIFEAGETWDTVSVDVTTALAEAAGSYTQFSNMIMSIDKYYTQAEIYSRESSYAPVLKAEVNGVLKTFPCVKDATVCAGSYGNTNYGNQTVLYVEEGGTYQSYTDRDRRAFLAFDISSLKSSDTIENARIELRIRQTGTGTKELLCYWYKDASWLENTVTWNSFSDMLAFSCNDVECWDYVTSSKTNVKGKICGYHRLNEPTKVSKLYVYYKDDSSVDAEAYAYTYIRQQMGLINSIGCDPSVMNSLDMSNHVTNGTTALYQLIDSVYMTPERFTAFLKHYAAMTDYQVRNNFGRQDNNWGTYATASAYNMSARFPELTQHDYWMEKTRDENDRLFQGLTFEDGMCMELSQNYIVTLLGTFNTPMATYKLTGEPLPFSDQMLDDIYDLVLSLLYCSGPYGGGFNMGDGYDPYTSYQNTFVTWYRNLFSDDPYIAYAASGGGLGCLPSNPTTHYPAGLRTYMRSDWTQNALALSITNKMANASHGHKDALSIAMFAYGKYLLVDPGYGGILTGTTRRYMISPVQHNVVTVNDFDDYLNTGKATSASTLLDQDGVEEAFESNGQYDFVEYSTEAYTATALSQRSVLFLKNQKFWIVTDYLVPNDPSVENTYHQNWHLYPGANMSSDGNKAVRSNYTNEPNVLIVPAAPEDIDTLEYVDTYYSEAAGQLQDGKKARYGKVQTGNALFGTVLFPMDTGEDYTVTTSAVSGTANASYANAFSFTVKNNQTGAVQTYYYYHLNDPSMKQAVTVGNYTTDAQTLLVQEDAAGNYVSAFLMHGSYLRNADTNRTLFNSPQEVGAIACTIEDGVLALASSELQKSQLNGMSFYAGAAAAATFNGSPAAGTAENGLITFSGLTDDPEEEPQQPAGTVIKDTYYNSIEEMEQDHWSFSYDEDLYTIETQQGGVRFTNIGSVPFLEDGSNNGGKSVYAGTTFEALVEEDPANGTSITGTGFSGVYAVEMTLQHNISTMRSVSTYATLRFGPLSSPTAVSKPWLEMRLYNGKINIVRTVDGVRSDIDKLGGIALRNDLEWKLKIVMNTVDRTYSVYINNVQVLAAVDLPFQQGTTGKYLPDFAFYMMDANNVGSYVWIKNIKIYEIERDTADARYQAVMEALSAAPQAIAENPDAVTANLTLPVLEGLTWQTTDADVITAQGVVTQGDENREAELYVTASSAALNGRAYSYRKNYHIQVPAAGGGSGDNSGSSEWALSPITLQDGQATLTVYNESGRYEEEPLLILTAYDGSGRVVGCDLRAVQQQEELVWTVPPGAYGVSAYLWDTALRPLTGKSVG